MTEIAVHLREIEFALKMLVAAIIILGLAHILLRER